MAAINFKYDPEEIVSLPGVGMKRLRTYVREIMSMPVEERQLVSLFRSGDKLPAILDITHIQWLARQPEFALDDD